MGDGGWEQFEGQDVPCDEPLGRSFPAASAEELAACRGECLGLGYGGFLVQKGSATFRPHSRKEVLEQKTSSIWGRGTVLHVAPAATGSGGGITVVHGEAVRQASAEALASKSGYFAALFRNSWADGCGCHSFGEFPGGEDAFALALAWLDTGAGASVGEPWPVREYRHARDLVHAAAYLDAPGLLRAASCSWRLATVRPREQLLLLAEAIAEASLQFSGEDQELVVGELRSILQELPRHALALGPEFLVAPAAGLAVLEVRHAARESLYGHIRNVGSWVGSVIGTGGERGGHGAEAERLSPHEFAIRLFEQHEPAFLARKSALRQLLSYVDPALPIDAPLCFRLAAAAVAAEAVQEGEVFAGRRLAVDIFERGVGAAPDPAQAAAEGSCVVGLFGAGRVGAPAPLGLDVLARPLVPPAAAAVVLSRVLSSWAVEGGPGGADGALAVLSGVATDRQRLRALLVAVQPRIAADGSGALGTEWGGSSDFAVPELCAAFTSAAAAAVEAARNGAAAAPDETLRLLFRVLYQPSGGLPDVHFPLALLAEVRDHNPACAALAAHRALAELRLAAEQGDERGWALSEELWPVVCCGSAESPLVESAVELLRTWLARAGAAPARWSRDAAEEAAVRLLRRLPLERLSEPEEVLGPPVPAHVLACLARREQANCAARVSELEAENEALRLEVARLGAERHKSG